MNKNELITKVGQDVELPKAKVGAVLDSVLENIAKSLEKGESAAFLGFGSFNARHRAARNGRNPRTRQKMLIPARIVPEFKPSIRLKERVNKGSKKK